jgi:alginate O-acetyltransferase complex protein AlgI
MLFNSFTFLLFFAVLVILYYVLPSRLRWPLLLVASFGYYYAFTVLSFPSDTFIVPVGSAGFVWVSRPGAIYLLLLLGASVVAYLAGIGIRVTQGESKKLVLALGVLISLAPLAIFKYFDFFAGSVNDWVVSSQKGASPIFARLGWLLPVGLSFFTFSSVSYLVEVYKGKIPAELNLGRLALYVSFFPKLLAGPIDRATNFLPQVVRKIRFNSDDVTAGLQLVLWGLFKKVVIADRLAVIVNEAYKNPQMGSPIYLIIAVYFYAFQIHCDFSGYSDIAIGLARILGFNLMENFRRPYLATSIMEFWGRNRWHISLNNWFREYMFFPMGGSRVPQIDKFFNLLSVFVVSGLWHGANWTFIIWGALNGIYQIIWIMVDTFWNWIGALVQVPRTLASFLHGFFDSGPILALRSVFGCLLTFHLVLIAWVFFRANSFADAQAVLTRSWAALPRFGSELSALAQVVLYRIVPTGAVPKLGPEFTTLQLRPDYSDIVLSIALIAVLMIIEIVDEHRPLWEGLRRRPVVVRWAFYYAVLACLVVFGKWGFSQFVYMSF